MGRWSISFRSGDFNGDDRRNRPKRGHRQAVNDLALPLPGEGQHPCPRGTFCASATRDDEGTLHPLIVNSAFCPADEAAIANALPGLPRSYALAAALVVGEIPAPSRPAGGGRRPPESRVPLNTGADALMRTAAVILGSWAARVRQVPGLQLTPPTHPHDQAAGVRDNCLVLARHVTQLLALPHAPVTRTWQWPAGNPMPDWLEAEIGHLETVYAGDGWVTCVTELGGTDAGLDVLDLAAKFRRILGESPARPESLDGIPCRDCEEMCSLVRADPPSDPAAEAMHSRCTACGDMMNRGDYDDWVRQYSAYASGGGRPPVCRRCELGRCMDLGCGWLTCGCTREGHRTA